MNSPPPKPEVILTNFFAEPTVLLVPITSRALGVEQNLSAQKSNLNMMNIYEESTRNFCVLYNTSIASIVG